MSPRARAVAAGSLSIATLVAATTLTASRADAAAVPKCQGQRATIVGSPNIAELKGTSHRDVIVTNSSKRVTAGGGDDLICVTGRQRRSILEDGPGKDVVDARHGAAFLIYLGPGADRVFGSEAPDEVRFDGRGRDTISLNGGNDQVSAGNARAEVDLGPGDDRMYAATEGGPVKRFTGGPGRDSLSIFASSESAGDDHVLSNNTHAFRVDGEELVSWKSFQDFTVWLPIEGTFRFDGTPADERLNIYGQTTPPTSAINIVVDLGGGDDELDAVPCSYDVRGGEGDDTLAMHEIAAPWCAGEGLAHSLLGEGGDDTIVGSDLDDYLNGGSGTDSVDGRAGTDQCVAENLTNCEGALGRGRDPVRSHDGVGVAP